MLSASRSWLCVPTLRRLYATPATKRLLKSTRTSKTQYGLPKISTLRPGKFVYSDFLMLAGRFHPSFHTELSYNTLMPTHQVKYKPEIYITTLRYQICAAPRPDSVKGMEGLEDDNVEATASGKEGGTKREIQIVRSPFPEGAQGFLYLHQPPPESGLPRSASSIRFRCAPSLVEASSSYVASLKATKKVEKGKKSQSVTRADPLVHLPSSIKKQKLREAFKAGYDLVLPDDTPWSISVVKVAGRPYLKYIRNQLVEDELFSESDMQEYEDFHKNTNVSRESNSLKTLDDVFVVRFDKPVFVVWNTAGGADQTKEGDQAVPEQLPRIIPRSSVLKNAFIDKRPEYDNKMPYTGAAHARFELAPGSNPSSPALSLRIVKITEPVKCVIPDYDGYVHIPKEGELVTLGLPDKPEPWIHQIDPSKYAESAILSLVPGYVANEQLH